MTVQPNKGILLTHPQILSLVLLLVDLLLNQVLVLRVVGVDNHDGLPPSPAALGISRLEHRGGDEDGQGQTLSIDTGLDQLLGGGEVLVLADSGEGDAHAGQPTGEDDSVPVLAAPVLEALHLRGLLARLLEHARRLVLVKVHGVLLLGERDTVPLRHRDSTKGARRRDQEGAERQRQRPEGGVPFGSAHDACETQRQADATADQASLYGCAVVGGFFFFADDSHDCGFVESSSFGFGKCEL